MPYKQFVGQETPVELDEAITIDAVTVQRTRNCQSKGGNRTVLELGKTEEYVVYLTGPLGVVDALLSLWNTTTGEQLRVVHQTHVPVEGGAPILKDVYEEIYPDLRPVERTTNHEDATMTVGLATLTPPSGGHLEQDNE